MGIGMANCCIQYSLVSLFGDFLVTLYLSNNGGIYRERERARWLQGLAKGPATWLVQTTRLGRVPPR
jgi:hypothetical protein